MYVATVTNSSSVYFMEFPEFGTCSAVAVAVAAVALLLMLSSLRTPYRNKKLPPGPRGWPVVGNLLQLNKKEEPLYQTLYALSKLYGPVMSLKLGKVPLVVISSLDKAKDAFKLHDLALATRPPTLMGRIIFYENRGLAFCPYNHDWKDARRMCLLHLTSADYTVAIRTQEVRSMTDKLVSNNYSRINMSHEIFSMVSKFIWRALWGLHYVENQEISPSYTFKQFVDDVFECFGMFYAGDLLPWLDFNWMDFQGIRRNMIKVHTAYDGFADSVIRDRVKGMSPSSGGDRFLDFLLEESWELEKIKALMLELFVAGSDTSAITMEWAMALLVKNTHAMQSVQEEIVKVVGKGERVKEEHLDMLKYLQCVVKETMRMYPVGPLPTRNVARGDEEMFGYVIPKGSTVFVNLWAISRDPSLWKCPEEFRPERWMTDDDQKLDLQGFHDLRSTPFGGGRRGCPGSLMAIRIILLGLANLLHCFRWKAPPDEEIDMSISYIGVKICRKYPLMLCPQKREVFSS